MPSKGNGNYYYLLKKFQKAKDHIEELKEEIIKLKHRLKAEESKDYNKIIEKLIGGIDADKAYNKTWKKRYEELFRRAKELTKIDMLNMNVFEALFDQKITTLSDTERFLLFGTKPINVEALKKKIGIISEEKIFW